MPFSIVRGDILELDCDVIVNPTDERLSGDGGLDRQIHQAAGPALDLNCRDLAPILPGRAVMTKGYKLGRGGIIHTAAPWYTGEAEQIEQLRCCYKNSLALAEDLRARSIALPLIGTGFRGFPKDLVLDIAKREIRRFLINNEDCHVTLVVHDMSQFMPSQSRLDDLEHFRHSAMRSLEDTACFSSIPEAPPPPAAPKEKNRSRLNLPSVRPKKKELHDSCAAPAFDPKDGFTLDESFSQMLLRKIDEKGMTDPECYHRANIDRKLFSKIRNDVNYRPRKTTAVALAMALELNLRETKELLEKAGYSLSRSILFDVIIEYCILERIYDLFEVNELLFKHDQSILG